MSRFAINQPAVDTMEISLSHRKHNVETTADKRGKCDECGQEYSNLLLTEICSEDHSQTYYACPRCLTKVSEIHKRPENKPEEEQKPISPEHLTKETPEKSEESGDCQHFFGYLKKRGKDESIPEDCLTCDKMIECMVS